MYIFDNMTEHNIMRKIIDMTTSVLHKIDVVGPQPCNKYPMLINTTCDSNIWKQKCLQRNFLLWLFAKVENKQKPNEAIQCQANQPLNICINILRTTKSNDLCWSTERSNIWNRRANKVRKTNKKQENQPTGEAVWNASCNSSKFYAIKIFL